MKKRILILVLFTGLAIKAQTQVASFTDSLDIMIGQMVMVGVDDIQQISDYSKIYQHILRGEIGGVVLYQKNVSANNSKQKLKELINQLQSYARVPLFIGIDEEGGKVSRLKPKDGFPNNVSAQYLGKIDNLDSTIFYANQTASLLKELGINMNYAPVLDVNTNPSNPIIGKIKRSYSANPEIIAKHAEQVIIAHLENGVVPVAKHFPGHGSSTTDTHLGLTDVSKTWNDLELIPYKKLLQKELLDGIMTAHIINRKLDGDANPATLSPTIINEILRKEMNYQGVVFSDDMQMGAISNEYGTPLAIKMAINGGIDVLMFANNVTNFSKIDATQIHSIIKRLVEKNEIDRKKIENSYRRIIKLKRKVGILPTKNKNFKFKIR